MSTRILVTVSIAFLGLFFTGCASIVGGTSQMVTINSNVKGAKVIVNGAVVGTTPYTGPIKREKSATVTLQKDGYDSKTMTLNTEFENIFWGNALFSYGASTSSTVDFISGAMYKYAPATLQIDLDKTQVGN